MRVRLPLSRFSYLLLVGLFLSTLRGYAQSPAPAWTSAVTLGQREVNNTATSSSRVVATTEPDAEGNLYVAGYFVGTVPFGSTTLVSTLLAGYTDIYSSDLFVAKWSVRDNRYLWATSTSGPGSEGVSQLVVSGRNLYVAGTTYSRLNKPGSLRFGTTTFPTGQGYSIFMAKLTDTGTSGTWQWGKIGSNEYLATVAGLAVSGTAVYLVGDLAGTMTMDGKSVKSNQTLAYNASDLLLIKLTDAGATATLNWMQLAGSSTYEEADALAVSGTTLYVAGNYFNTSTIGSTTMPNTGAGTSTDAFVTKFTDTGSAVTTGWTQHIGGTGYDGVKKLVASGNTVYLAGNFSSPSLGFGTPVTATLLNQGTPSAGTYDLFLAKLVDAGASSSFAWTKQVGGVGSEQAARLLRTGNTLFLGGSFQGPTATFGNTVLTNTTTQGDQWEVYVARFEETATGAELRWAQQAGSSSYDYVYSLNLLGSRLYVHGYAEEAAAFGSVTLPKASSYLASLSPDVPLPTTGTTVLPAFTLYPNPARASVTLHVPALTGVTQATLTLHDALGRVVQTKTAILPAMGLSQPLSVEGLPSGIYWVQLQAGTTRAVRQLVVE